MGLFSIFEKNNTMKKIALFALSAVCSIGAFAQGGVGLIAHWNMNGSFNDVSGNAHVSRAVNVTPAAGRTGAPNTAYYFNGVNSMISTPYVADLSLTNYSICAIIKIKGYNSGLCQANTVVGRGFLQQPGAYTLQFNDNPNDGNDCAAFDTTKQVFQANAGATGSGSAGVAMWDYAPRIVSDAWYKVVATWDGTKYKIWVNDTLKTTLVSITGGAFGTSTDSLAIGFHPFGAGTGYPFPFKGIIDDVKIYNRALHDSEVIKYGDTCGYVTGHPTNKSIVVGSNTKYYVMSTIAAASYRWQVDTGTGYYYLTSSTVYSGVNADTLRVTGATADMSGNRYRCAVFNEFCSDTSAGAMLTATLGVNDFQSARQVTVIPNPATDYISVRISDGADGRVQLLNSLGQIVLDDKISRTNDRISIGYLPAGIYICRVTSGEEIYISRLIKN